MELSRLIQSLPADQLNKMQSLMHNMMAGHDVKKEMEEFEKNLPPGFREKLMAAMGSPGGFSGFPGAAVSGSQTVDAEFTPVEGTAEVKAEDMDLRGARLTILRAVASGQMTPEQAEKLLS